MNSEQILGTWRLTKVVWDNKERIYSDNDDWIEDYFKPDGTHDRVCRNGGAIQVAAASQKWIVGGEHIIVTSFDREWHRVETLTSASLVLKKLTSEIYWHYRKMQ